MVMFAIKVLLQYTLMFEFAFAINGLCAARHVGAATNPQTNRNGWHHTTHSEPRVHYTGHIGKP